MLKTALISFDNFIINKFALLRAAVVYTAAFTLQILRPYFTYLLINAFFGPYRPSMLKIRSYQYVDKPVVNSVNFYLSYLFSIFYSHKTINTKSKNCLYLHLSTVADIFNRDYYFSVLYYY